MMTDLDWLIGGAIAACAVLLLARGLRRTQDRRASQRLRRRFAHLRTRRG